MSGVMLHDPAPEGLFSVACVEFATPSDPAPDGCYDFRVCQEWFRRRVPWPVHYNPNGRLLDWLDATEIRHEWHAIVQVEDVSSATATRRFEGVFYMIRFFNKTDASAYRLIFA